MEITIYPGADVMSSEALKSQLEIYFDGKEDGIQFEVRNAPIRVRGIDPTVLIAVVGAAGTAFGTLISGLLQVAQHTTAKTIVIQAQNGSRIEFPANLSSEKIDLLIEKAKQLDVQKIILSK